MLESREAATMLESREAAEGEAMRGDAETVAAHVQPQKRARTGEHVVTRVETRDEEEMPLGKERAEHDAGRSSAEEFGQMAPRPRTKGERWATMIEQLGGTHCEPRRHLAVTSRGDMRVK